MHGSTLKYATTFRYLILAFAVLILGACTSMITSRLGNNLSSAILNQDDPETVKAGAPAYLLLIDSLIEGSPNDVKILIAGAKLYSVYDAVFVEDQERAQRMSAKAKDYARRAVCLKREALCTVDQGALREMLPVLGESRYEDLPALYTYALAWALWIQNHSEDWSAVADLPKVEAILNRVVELKDDFERGQAHLYLAILHAQRPPALGGKPELAKKHFEEALKHSQGQDLVVKVEYAKRYARMIFDQELHDRLLNEVLSANAVAPGYTLSNVLAQRQAKQLLNSSADYF